MESWITTKTELNTNKEEVSKFLFKVFTVDSNGKTLDETEFDSESNIIYKRIYRYFDTGEVSEYVEFDPSDDLLERHTYILNDHGEIDKIEYEFIDGKKLIKEFSYSDLGNMDKATIRDENGLITGYEVYIGDEHGRLIREIELDSDNNEINKYEKTYNENGSVILQKHFVDGQLISDEKMYYNDDGLLIKTVLANHIDKFKFIENSRYDKNGNNIYISAHQNGVLIFENKCGYDKNDMLIYEEFFELDYWERKILRHEKLEHEIKK